MTVIPNEARHTHASDNVVLAQNSILVVAETSHGHTVEFVILTQQNVLQVAEALHAHSADRVVWFVVGYLTGTLTLVPALDSGPLIAKTALDGTLDIKPALDGTLTLSSVS
jgi:hypothetical protein